MKTAVEYLQKELFEKFVLSDTILFIELIAKAKEMEKESHKETWDVAHQAGRFEEKGIAEENWQTFETYWEENI
jgi:hypothetical protein